MSRKEAAAARLGPDGRRPLLLTFVGNNRQMLNEIRDSLSHLRKSDIEGGHHLHPHLFNDQHGSLLVPPLNKQDFSQSTPNLLDKQGGSGAQGSGGASKMTRRDNPHDKTLAEIRDSLRPYQNAGSIRSHRNSSANAGVIGAGSHSLQNGGGGSDNSSVASSTSSHATSSDPEPSPSKVQLITQYGFDEDLAVRALKLSGNQSAEAALQLLFDLIRSTTSGMYPIGSRSAIGPSSPAPSDTSNSVRSDSPGLSGVGVTTHRHHQQRQQQQQQLHAPPPLPPRAPINSVSGNSASNRGQTPPPSSAESSLAGQQNHNNIALYSQHQFHPAGSSGNLKMQVQGHHQQNIGLIGQQSSISSSSSNVPQGYVQQMVQQMSPTAGQTLPSYFQHQTSISSASSSSPIPSAVAMVNGVAANVQGKIVGTQRGISPITNHHQHPHHPAMIGVINSSAANTSAQSPMLSQQLQSLILGSGSNSSAPSTPSSCPSPAPSSLSGSGFGTGVRYTQAPPPSYSQAQAQIKAARMGAAVAQGPDHGPSLPSSAASSSIGSDSIDPRRPSPLLDVTMLPDLHQQHTYQHQQHILHKAKAAVASSAVSATRVNSTHMPVIMPSVRSKEVTKPMPQTATAPVAPPAPITTTASSGVIKHNPVIINGGNFTTSGNSANFVSQYQAQINNLASLPNHANSSAGQQHTPRIMASAGSQRRDLQINTNNNIANGGLQAQLGDSSSGSHTPPVVNSNNLVPHLLRNGGGNFTPEQLAALAAASTGQPTIPIVNSRSTTHQGGAAQFTSKRSTGLHRQFHNMETTVGHMSTPRSDSPVSRATNQSPMSILSTTSSPSTNSDIPDKPPPPYPGRGSNFNQPLPAGGTTPPIIPPLLPPRIPLKDKPPPPPPPDDNLTSQHLSSAQQNPPSNLPPSIANISSLSVATFSSSASSSQSPPSVPIVTHSQANQFKSAGHSHQQNQNVIEPCLMNQQQTNVSPYSDATMVIKSALPNSPLSLPPSCLESSSPPSETDETDTDASSVSVGTNSSSTKNVATTGTVSTPAGGGMQAVDCSKPGASTSAGQSGNTQETTTTRCLSPLPQRKSEAKERDRLRCDTKVRNYSPQAFKFYMEQHVENVLKSHSQRMNRRIQLEKEMAKVKLSEEAARQMRKMLHQKESNYIRLKRAKMDPSMFDKIQTLGVGAFGEVALVRKKDVGSLYAMKTLTKSNVIKRNQVAHVKAERDILAEADNEWVVKLYYSFQDEQNLYFVMDYVPGGDLMGQLIRKEILDEHLAQFYIAELVLAIESVHRMGFIHRDIKPDNILIDKDGHIKLTDFGLCTGFRWTHNSKYYQKDGTHARQDSMEVNCQLDDQCRCEILKPLEQRRQREQKRGQAHSLVGTPNYIAPEVLRRLGYTKVCDWWSVGVILYEMVIGQPPFYANTPLETQYKVIHWKDTLNMQYCCNISPEAQDLIRQLLQGPESRLGRNDAQEIKQHRFFAGINFEGLRRQPAPEKPTIRYLTDTSNFDPVDPDKLQTNDSEDNSKKAGGAKTENGRHQEHAFYEFTFRRFFDDGGHPCPMPQPQAQQQVTDQDSSNNAPVYV